MSCLHPVVLELRRWSPAWRFRSCTRFPRSVRLAIPRAFRHSPAEAISAVSGHVLLEILRLALCLAPKPIVPPETKRLPAASHSAAPPTNTLQQDAAPPISWSFSHQPFARRNPRPPPFQIFHLCSTAPCRRALRFPVSQTCSAQSECFSPSSKSSSAATRLVRTVPPAIHPHRAPPAEIPPTTSLCPHGGASPTTAPAAIAPAPALNACGDPPANLG